MAEAMYAGTGQGAGAGATGVDSEHGYDESGTAGGATGGQGRGGDDVVDAEFHASDDDGKRK
jgi:hypothetical protein